MAARDKTKIVWNDSNAKLLTPTFSFIREEMEWHVWYDVLEDRTYAYSNWSTGITKMQTNPSFVLIDYTKSDSGHISSARGYIEGQKLTVRR